MVDVETMRELYRYNRWANDRSFAAVAPLTPEQFVQNLGNSYPSLRDTLTQAYLKNS